MERFVFSRCSPATQLCVETNCGEFKGLKLSKAGYGGLLVAEIESGPVNLWVNIDLGEVGSATKYSSHE